MICVNSEWYDIKESDDMYVLTCTDGNKTNKIDRLTMSDGWSWTYIDGSSHQIYHYIPSQHVWSYFGTYLRKTITNPNF